MPIPLIAGVIGGAFLGSLAKDLVTDLIKDIIGNTQKGAIDYVKYKTFRDYFKTWTLEFYQSLLARPHVSSGIDPEGLTEMVLMGLETIAKMSLIFDPEVTNELFLEIIQEGFSNAIQFSIGGAFQNILSYWRGSYGVQTGQSYNVLQVLDNIDDDIFVWLLLSSGEHVITLLFETLYGLQQKYESDKEFQMSQILSIIDYINRVSFSWNETIRSEAERILARSLRIVEEYFDRLISFADSLLERFISRINELDAEVQSHKILLDNQVIPEETFNAVVIENTLLLDSTKQSFDYFISLIEDEISNAKTIDSIITTTVYDTLMQKIINEYIKLLSSITFKDYTPRIITALDKINAVRTYVFETGETSPPPFFRPAVESPYEEIRRLRALVNMLSRYTVFGGLGIGYSYTLTPDSPQIGSFVFEYTPETKGFIQTHSLASPVSEIYIELLVL
jgi:hypothetical protein